MKLTALIHLAILDSILFCAELPSQYIDLNNIIETLTADEILNNIDIQGYGGIYHYIQRVFFYTKYMDNIEKAEKIENSIIEALNGRDLVVINRSNMQRKIRLLKKIKIF